MTVLSDEQLKAAYNAPNTGHIGSLRAVADAAVAAINATTRNEIREVAALCHTEAVNAGWWNDPVTGAALPANVPIKLMLIVSEIAEAMEADRKDLMDDKLPRRKGIEVELADAVIRIFDLAGRLDLDVVGAMQEKILYNRQRADHKPENRAAVGGKKY